MSKRLVVGHEKPVLNEDGSLSISAKVVDVTDPTANQDAATKKYVDDQSAEVGGLYGINVETLSADKTLTAGTDEMYQYLDTGDDTRIITLDTGSATAGDRFIIRNNGDYGNTNSLQVKQATVTLEKIYAGAIREFIFDGTNWIAGEIGTGEADPKARNISIGQLARAHSAGVAIGGYTTGYTYGVAVGYSAWGYTYGVGVGRSARGYNYGVAIGYYATTNGKKYSIALGPYSETERVGETSVNINGSDTDQENNVVQGRWEGELAGGAGATEIFCGGQSNERFTIRPSSHLAFKMTVVARDNVANEGAMYTFEGLIKRDASNNTTMSIVNKAIIHEDDATWDVVVAADDTNEALIITVTGDASNPVQWAVRMDGVETHF